MQYGSTTVTQMVSGRVRRQARRLRQQFASADPFPHIAIDGFLETDKAEQLLADFPAFDPANARNEMGEVGQKAVVTNISCISPFYAEFHRYLGSREFLDLVSEITGISGLVHDEQMFGGGTHENLEGQELDPHVDFNYIEEQKLHRRLNLLLYLNKEWERDWGGCLEIHSNPRRSKENQIKTIDLAFNRCVIFETSERSWHGFERIRLPEGKGHLSRKLVSIYLYTHDRPTEEIAPPHSTFYVQRPLPQRFVAGYTLTAADVQEIETLCHRRDDWIEFYQKKELLDSRKRQDLIRGLEDTRVPLIGYALQEGPVRGLWFDRWVGRLFEVSARLRDPIQSVTIKGLLPDSLPKVALAISMNGELRSRETVRSGPFSIDVPAELKAGKLLTVSIESDASFCPARTSGSKDQRELVFLLTEVRCSTGEPEPAPVSPTPSFVQRCWRSFQVRFQRRSDP